MASHFPDFELVMDEIRAALHSGRFADALRQAEMLYDRATAGHNVFYQYHALNATANCHAMIGNYDEALRQFTICFSLTAQPDLAGYHCNTFNNIGAVYMRMENWPKALEYVQRALEMLPTALASRRGLHIVNVYDNLSHIYYHLGDGAAAKQAALDGMAACQAEGIPIANSTMMMLGRAHFLLKDYATALPCLEQAMHSDEGMHGDFWRGSIKMYISDVYLASGMPDKAEACLLEALELFTRHSLQADLIQVHERLYALHRQRGDFARALDHHERMHRFKERNFNEQSDARFKTLQAIHEVEKARLERESAIQRSDNLLHELDARERLIADLDGYARMVAHDLINPITAISGAADLLLMEFEEADYPPRLTRMASVVQSASTKALQIIETLLEVARVQRTEMGARPVDMGAIIDEVIARLHGTIESMGARVTRADALPAAMGDARWLEEVFANLISNAIKYGGAPPVVRIEPAGAEAGCVAFAVRDNGEGLSEEEQGHLFTAFTRLDRHQGAIAGHGLGLHIVKTIVEKLNGAIDVESEGVPGRGSAFIVTLPAVSG